MKNNSFYVIWTIEIFLMSSERWGLKYWKIIFCMGEREMIILGKYFMYLPANVYSINCRTIIKHDMYVCTNGWINIYVKSDLSPRIINLESLPEPKPVCCIACLRDTCLCTSCTTRPVTSHIITTTPRSCAKVKKI